MSHFMGLILRHLLSLEYDGYKLSRDEAVGLITKHRGALCEEYAKGEKNPPVHNIATWMFAKHCEGVLP